MGCVFEQNIAGLNEVRYFLRCFCLCFFCVYSKCETSIEVRLLVKPNLRFGAQFDDGISSCVRNIAEHLSEDHQHAK